MLTSFNGKGGKLMSTIQLHKDFPDTVTCVPNTFIDRFMPEANGEFVKVYLYLLRSLANHSQDCTISAIADQFNHTEADVVRALRYWERMQLLQLEYDKDKSVCAIHFPDAGDGIFGSPDKPAVSGKRPAGNPAASTDNLSADDTIASTDNPPADDTIVPTPSLPAGNTSAAAASNVVQMHPARKEYTLDEIRQFQKNDSVSELFFIIETYLKHPLSSTDTNTILYWYDALHFPPDLIIYLVEYCISKGHSSMRYMDKVAMGWSDSHITTVEQAKENAASHSQAYYSVMKAFGITGRNLVDSEASFIRRWTKDFGFDLPLVLEACRRTMTATHQPSFEYTDSILTSWHNNHVHTLEDVKALDQVYSRSRQASASTKEAPKRNKFNNFNQRDYDYDKLEKMLLTTSVQ